MDNQSQPTSNNSLYVTYRIYKDILKYEKKYADFIITNKNIGNSQGETYLQRYNEIVRGWNTDYGNEGWFGENAPQNYDELMGRNEYQNMAEYNDIYQRLIFPFANEIAFNSQSFLDEQKLKYNDLGLGIFDFNKASLGLQPLYEFYSLLYDKYIPSNDVKTVKIDKKFVYQYKLDNSKVILVPKIKANSNKKDMLSAFNQIADGKPILETIKKYNLKIAKFTSSIKKTYLNKDIVQKPLKSIRIFCGIGDNMDILGQQYKYTGYAAIGVAEALMLLGYNVCIVGVFCIEETVKKPDGNYVSGVRLETILLKDFGENLDSKRLLYYTSDASFFRGKQFVNLVKLCEEYDDYIPSGLGRMVNENTLKNIVFNVFGKIDKKWKPNGENDTSMGFLYYIFSSIHSEQRMVEKMRDLVRNVINENEIARQGILQN